MSKTPPPLDLQPLDSWHALQGRIHSLTEETCDRLIEHELGHERRRNMVMRLHSKKNRLRAQRERVELGKLTATGTTGRRAGR